MTSKGLRKKWIEPIHKKWVFLVLFLRILLFICRTFYVFNGCHLRNLWSVCTFSFHFSLVEEHVLPQGIGFHDDAFKELEETYLICTHA